eukprot:364104-Chlamydomonas_euryale.AAC.7
MSPRWTGCTNAGVLWSLLGSVGSCAFVFELMATRWCHTPPPRQGEPRGAGSAAVPLLRSSLVLLLIRAP